MSEWQEVRLGDVADEVTVGHVGPMASEYQSDGIPFLRSQNVIPHGFDLSDVKYIGRPFHDRLRKSALLPGDVVTVRTGKPGTTAVVPASWGETNCADLVITRPGPELDSRWLSYYINGAVSGFISSRLVGAVQQHFNVGAAKSIILLKPELNEQRAIADVLGALDDKIVANAKIAATANELGSALYGGAFDDGNKRRLVLGQVIDCMPGKYLAKGIYSLGGPYTVYGSNSVMGSHFEPLYEGPFAVLARIGSSCGNLRWSQASGWVNNNACALVAKNGFDPWISRFLLDRVDMAPHRAGSGQPFIRIDSLLKSEVECPSKTACNAIAATLRNLAECEFVARVEAETLAATRDALLPLLMSGNLRVEDAEKQVEAVV